MRVTKKMGFFRKLARGILDPTLIINSSITIMTTVKRGSRDSHDIYINPPAALGV